MPCHSAKLWVSTSPNKGHHEAPIWYHSIDMGWTFSQQHLPRAKSSSLKITSPKTGLLFMKKNRVASHCIWVDHTAIVWVRPWDLFSYYSIKTNCQWSQWEFNLKGEVWSGTRETFTPGHADLISVLFYGWKALQVVCKAEMCSS